MADAYLDIGIANDHLISRLLDSWSCDEHMCRGCLGANWSVLPAAFTWRMDSRTRDRAKRRA